MVDAGRPPVKTVTELNLQVIKRWSPEVESVEYVAPYAVLYVFSPESGSWEKSGVEGTAFVCTLKGKTLAPKRYSVFVLNRRGMNNFDLELTSANEVELTTEYIILQTEEEGAAKVYGLWIFSEPPPSSTAGVRDAIASKIQIYAELAEQSRIEAVEKHSRGYDAEAEDEEMGVPMGRQVSLRELFGQQRREDAAFSVHTHSPQPDRPHDSLAQHAGIGHPSATQTPTQQYASSSVSAFTQASTSRHQMLPSNISSQAQPQSQFEIDPDTQFFRSVSQQMLPPPRPQAAPSMANDRPVSQQNALDSFKIAGSTVPQQQSNNPAGSPLTGQPPAQKDILMDLFKKAGDAHRAGQKGL